MQKQIMQYEAKDEPEEDEKPVDTRALSKKTRDTKLQRTFKGHLGSIARVAFHPKLPVIGTASDDHTWKLWSSPSGELVMSGEGHKDWVSNIAFHPKGSMVATTSGDATVKIWDMIKESCVHTF